MSETAAGDRLLATDELAGMQALEPVETVIHEDRYVDTPDGALEAAGYAGRLRSDGNGSTVITLKGLRRQDDGGALHVRTELEGPADPETGPAVAGVGGAGRGPGDRGRGAAGGPGAGPAGPAQAAVRHRRHGRGAVGGRRRGAPRRPGDRAVRRARARGAQGRARRPRATGGPAGRGRGAGPGRDVRSWSAALGGRAARDARERRGARATATPGS